MRGISKSKKRGGKATKDGVEAKDALVTQTDVRGRTYATEEELRTATLEACRCDLLKKALRSGTALGEAKRELDVRVREARSILEASDCFNRTSDVLRTIRDGLRVLAKSEVLEELPRGHLHELAVEINRSVGPALLAKLDNVSLPKFVGASDLLMFADAVERMGWTDFRAMACTAILAGYWPKLARYRVPELTAAEVIQTVREAVKFQWPKVRRMRAADAEYVPPKFRIVR